MCYGLSKRKQQPYDVSYLEGRMMFSAPLAITLTAPTTPQAVGVIIPVSIAVRNISDRRLRMVGVLDGLETGFRYPHYLPVITGPQPLPPPEGLGRCGNVARLRLEDFRDLNPGESFDPTVPQREEAYVSLVTFADFRPLFPGRYELRLTLSTESQRGEDWLGLLEFPGKELVLAQLAEVPRLRVESNVAVVEVQ